MKKSKFSEEQIAYALGGEPDNDPGSIASVGMVMSVRQGSIGAVAAA